MSAHGVALGLYRPTGAVDVIEEKRDWEALGYEVVEPHGRTTYVPKDRIVIERPLEHSRNILEQLLRPQGRDKELVAFMAFANKAQELTNVANEIVKLINDEGVVPEEIVVVTLSLAGSKSELAFLRSALNRSGIKSIMPGFIEKASLFKEKGHVTLTTPFRAKGNEANIVFVISTETVTSDATFRRRNAAFVSITRSRGWTYVSGMGAGAEELGRELAAILRDYPKLIFTYPEQVDLDRRRKILASDGDELQRINETLDEVLTSNKELLIEKLKSDPEMVRILRQQFGG
jgi:superfamily I DNA and RNA helicase